MNKMELRRSIDEDTWTPQDTKIDQTAAEIEQIEMVCNILMISDSVVFFSKSRVNTISTCPICWREVHWDWICEDHTVDYSWHHANFYEISGLFHVTAKRKTVLMAVLGSWS